ncbi:MAG: LLM class F420-dependent oxidoreductase [Actinobacteria bacterium]|nr:LLM class F420-dependent oxidoreductase [Actinomycetota bacterium]
MQFDLWVPTATPLVTAETWFTLGNEAEQRGYDRIWVGEHVVLFDDYDSSYPYADDGKIPVPPGTGLLDPLIALASLAGCTKRIRLGTAMLLLPQRNPVYTAKEVASLDWLSGGRVDLGIGVGWLAEEMEAAGTPFADRGARCDEYLDLMEQLWTQERVSHKGKYWELDDVRMDPKPLQEPFPPIHIGGESDAAIRRAARRGQGWHSFDRDPEGLAEGLRKLDLELERAGRSREGFTVTVCPYSKALNEETVLAYQEAGADSISALFLALDPSSIAPMLDELEPLRQLASSL